MVPTCQWPLSVAVEELTGFEVIGIEKRFGSKMEDLGATELLMGTVWAFENRNGSKVDWNAVQAKTMREMNGYFQEEPKEPDDEVGKGSDGATTPTGV